MAHLYVPAILLFSLLLPRIPNNIKILLLALAVVPGAIFIWRGFVVTRPLVWWLAVPLGLLCVWISIQTPLAAAQPVLLFGAKEATGVAVTLLMALVIPGVVATGHGWRPIDFGIGAVTILATLGIVFSFLTGTGERHHLGDGLFRAYFFFSDGMDVAAAVMLVWHSARRQWALAALAGVSLTMMLGKLPLGLLVLFVLAALIIGRQAERLTAAAVVGALILGIAITIPLGRWVENDRILTIFSLASFGQESQEVAPEDDEQTRSCVAQARAADSHGVSYLLRGECAASSTALYDGPFIVNAGINTLSRRTVGGIAAVYIISQNLILGTGYHQSWRLIDDMESINPFGVNDLYARPDKVWYRVRQIGNPVLRVAAELGVPGGVLFIALLIGSTVVALRIALAARKDGAAISASGVACALWIAVYMPFSQTAPWLLPGSVTLFWVGVALGLMLIGAVELREERERTDDKSRVVGLCRYG